MSHFGTIIGHFIVKKNIYINNNNNPKGSGHYCLCQMLVRKMTEKVHLLQKEVSHLGALEILSSPNRVPDTLPLQKKKKYLFFSSLLISDPCHALTQNIPTHPHFLQQEMLDIQFVTGNC